MATDSRMVQHPITMCEQRSLRLSRLITGTLSTWTPAIYKCYAIDYYSVGDVAIIYVVTAIVVCVFSRVR